MLTLLVPGRAHEPEEAPARGELARSPPGFPPAPASSTEPCASSRKMLLRRADRSLQPRPAPGGEGAPAAGVPGPQVLGGGVGGAAFGRASVGASLGACGGSDPPLGAEGWKKRGPSDPSLPRFPSDVRLSRCPATSSCHKSTTPAASNPLGGLYVPVGVGGRGSPLLRAARSVLPP